MKKDNYRKILSEKFKAANQLETGPLTEEDEEYLRILAEARANHAKIKAARQEARKRLAARVAAVLIIAALISSSYLLGMKSDTKASADNDDEVKVVQQGDNIIIGPGVSEEDENVGVVTKTYYSLEDVPEEVRENVNILRDKRYSIERIKLIKTEHTQTINVEYSHKNTKITINKKVFVGKELKITIPLNVIDSFKLDGIDVYAIESHIGKAYCIIESNVVYDIIINSDKEKIKIEDIIDDLNR